MNRRDFLQGLIAVAAAAAAGVEVDVDRLLWVPGRKTIFLPPEPSLSWPPDLVVFCGWEQAYGDDWTVVQTWNGIERYKVMSVEEYRSWAAAFKGLTEGQFQLNRLESMINERVDPSPLRARLRRYPAIEPRLDARPSLEAEFWYRDAHRGAIIERPAVGKETLSHLRPRTRRT